MQDNSVTLHKVFKAPPEKVFSAFSDANAYASWIPPYGFVGIVDSMDFREGGSYRMAFMNFTTKKTEYFGGTFREIKENELLVISDKFDDPSMPEEMTVTIKFKKNLAGTELFIEQKNIPPSIPSDFCYLGWQDSLDKLSRLVEPNIPDA